MSTHPNAILLLTLTPDGLARATYRAILADAGVQNNGEDSDNIKIGSNVYDHRVMEDDYYEDSQIAAKEGDIVLWDLVTYGYGEKIRWADLEARKAALEQWAQDICKRHACKFEIWLTANYW